MTYNRAELHKPDVLALYIKAGIMLTPCVGNSPFPAQKGFLNTPYDPTFVPTAGNYQAILNHRYLVLDIDPRHFPKGDQPLKRLFDDLQIDRHGLFADTFIVKTPSKGFHVYFSKTDAVSIQQNLKDYPGIEFKDRWIMAAGSYREVPADKPKGPYSVDQGTPLHIKPAPTALLALLTRPERVDIVAEGLVADHPTNIKQFIQFCQTCEPAVEHHGGDNWTWQVAARGKDKSLSKAKTFEIMAEHFNPRCVGHRWTANELMQKIENAYNFGTMPIGIASIENEFSEPPQNDDATEIKWDLTKDGAKRKTRNNLFNIMFKGSAAPCKGLLQYNEFSHKIELRKRPLWSKDGAFWDDSDAIQLAHYLSAHHQYEASVNIIHETAIAGARQNSYHPVKNYLNSLTWERDPVLSSWLVRFCGAPNTKYVRWVGRKILIAAVARIMQPGIKFDHVLVLEGQQGIGKSLLCATLATPWFSDAHFDVKDKDSIALLQGHWIVELAEMSVLNKSAIEILKAFITRQVDKMRPAYGRTVQEFKRQCIFIGTINPENQGYLRDPTGNRRFWPVPIGVVDFAGLKEVRDQLWAEAYHYYKRGEEIHVNDPKIYALIEREIIKRQQEDPWFEVVEKFIENNYSDYITEGSDMCVIMPSEVYENALDGQNAKITNYEAVRISNILVRLGFERSAANNKRTSRYCKPFDAFL